jgi:hypothetical protein
VADINVERRKRSPLPLILGLIVLAAVAFFAWRYMSGQSTPAADANRVGVPAAKP